jgi:hypothetical protein
MTEGWVQAHITPYFAFDTPLLDFEAVEPAVDFDHVPPALDFSFAGAADAVEEVAGLAFGCQQRICVSQEQQQQTLPTRSIFVLSFVSSGVIKAVSSTSSIVIALGSSSSTSGSAPFLAFSPLFFPPIPPLTLNQLSSPLPSSSHPRPRPASQGFRRARDHDTPYAHTTSVYRDVSSRILHSNLKSVVRSTKKKRKPRITLVDTNTLTCPSRSFLNTSYNPGVENQLPLYLAAFVVYLAGPILAALRPSPRRLRRLHQASSTHPFRPVYLLCLWLGSGDRSKLSRLG